MFFYMRPNILTTLCSWHVPGMLLFRNKTVGQDLNLALGSR